MSYSPPFNNLVPKNDVATIRTCGRGGGSVVSTHASDFTPGDGKFLLSSYALSN